MSWIMIFTSLCFKWQIRCTITFRIFTADGTHFQPFSNDPKLIVATQDVFRDGLSIVLKEVGINASKRTDSTCPTEVRGSRRFDREMQRSFSLETIYLP